MNAKHFRLGFIALALLVAVSSQASGQVFCNQGIDVWHTPEGGTIVEISIPPGFFCPNSPPMTVKVELRGKRIVTDPPGALGLTDTIIRREDPFQVFPGQCADVKVVLQALSLVSSSPLIVDACPCSTWDVKVIPKKRQRPGLLQICQIDDCGGFIRGNIPVNVNLFFRNRECGIEAGPLMQTIDLEVNNLPWSRIPPPGAVIVPPGTFVDTDCDHIPDTPVGGTCPDFFPGAHCGQPTRNCHPAGEGICHEHCVEPPRRINGGIISQK